MPHDPAHALCDHRVLIVAGDQGTPSYRYRALHTAEQLGMAGIPALLCRHGTPGSEMEAAGGSRAVLFLHRVGLDPWVAEALERARRRGWTTVADIDDLVFDVRFTPWVRGLEVLPPGSAAGYDAGVEMYRRCMRAVDAVTVPTDALARHAAGLGRPVYVYRNALSGAHLALAEAAAARGRAATERSATIGYFSGTYTHNHDFRTCTGALIALLKKWPELQLLVQGPLDLSPGLDRFASRIHRGPLVEWTALPQIMRQTDIQLAPLEQGNPFCQAKSELKYMEAGVLGLPTVATPTESFRHAITPGVNGLLAADPDAWVRELDRLIADAGFRLRLGAEARRDVVERYHPRRRADELVRILGEIVSGAR